jgi:choice-of-anchor B domain-containing protein
MKKCTLLLTLSVCLIKLLPAQNLNLVLADQLSYGSQSLSNIDTWKDPQDGKEYALVGAANGLSIVDITNPSNVTQIVQIPGPNSIWREVKTNGNYAYVTTEAGAYGLQIVNLTNLPATNLQSVTWTPTISSTQLKTIHALHIDNGKVYLYGTNVGNKGAIIADITTNPMAPVYLGKYDNRYIHDGYVRNDTLYACHIYDGDCEIVNCANPAAGVSIGDFQTPNNFAHNSWLSANSKICFTTDEVDNSYLASFDVSNLNNISELDRIQSNPGSQSVVHNTHVVQKNGVDYCVTSWYKDGFTIVDASHPSNLVQVGNYDTAPAASGGGMENDWGVGPFLPSGTIVASDMANGLFVLTPTYVRACFLEGTIMNCSTGNPLAGAQIKLLNPPPQNVNSATDITDALGKYGVGVVTPGTYTVVVSKQAYVSQSFTVAVTAGNTTVLNVNLCPQSSPFAYSGHVYDAMNANPIAGANIHLQDSSLIWDTITDVNGNFTIPNMLSGSYNIIVGHWGYITQCFSFQNINSASPALSVGLLPGIYDDFSFNWGWTVSGTCGNAWEKGIPVGTYDTPNGGATANPAVDDQTDCSDQCYITDNGGGAVSDHDVDPPGYTILTSPVFNPSAYSDPYISYSRWFYDAKLNSSLPNDTMTITISNGSTTVLLERMIKTTAGNGTWVHKLFKISSVITPSATMQIKISTSDAGPGGTIVEGGFDKFYVYDSATVAVGVIENTEGVSVFPNPFNSTAILQIQQNVNETSVLTLFDLFGREVKSQRFTGRELKLTRNGLTPGVYFFKVVNKNEIIGSGKILVE